MQQSTGFFLNHGLTGRLADHSPGTRIPLRESGLSRDQRTAELACANFHATDLLPEASTLAS
jgi:hypothetical protein